MNDNLSHKNFTNAFQNFQISKNTYYISNANNTFANNKNDYILIYKGNENSENNHPKNSGIQKNFNNSISNTREIINQKEITNPIEITQKTSKNFILSPNFINEMQIPFDYLFEIWTELISSELLFPCLPKYDNIVNNQLEISFETRAVLIDWLIDVQIHFKCANETLFLCFSIIDTYLSLRLISKQKLQLLGITAFSIACKYEEIYPPYLKDLVNITDNTFSSFEILQMEGEILTLLKFHITFPTCISFLQMISYQFKFSIIEFYYGCYLMEMYTLHPNFNKFLPSLIALGVAYIILKSKKYERYRDLYQLINNRYNEIDLKICAKEIYDFGETFSNLNFKAVIRKYSSEKFKYVAINGLKGY